MAAFDFNLIIFEGEMDMMCAKLFLQGLTAFLVAFFLFSSAIVSAKTIAEYDRDILSHPFDAKAYFERGNAYADYNKALEINPNYDWAYNNRGVAYQELGDNVIAQADFAKARELGYTG